jgi:hypothetical protein
MSWSLDTKKLSHQAEQQFSQLIKETSLSSLMFCSTHDQGKFHDASTPANLDSTISITSYDAGPTNANFAEKQDHTFYFPAERIPLGFLPGYLKHNSDLVELSTGSSYATALAVGFASFVLKCVQIAYYTPDNLPEVDAQLKVFKDHAVMTRVFQHCCVQDKKQYVLPWKLVDRDLFNDEESAKKNRDTLKSRLYHISRDPRR